MIKMHKLYDCYIRICADNNPTAIRTLYGVLSTRLVSDCRVSSTSLLLQTYNPAVHAGPVSMQIWPLYDRARPVPIMGMPRLGYKFL